MNPTQNLIVISADTQGKAIYPVQSGAATTVKAKAGEHYRVVFYKDGIERLLDDVIAVYRNGDLVLMYADGTEVVLENYVEACQGNACRVSLPKGKVGMESDGEEEAYELSGNENGTVLSNHDVMVYAHGDQNALMSMVAHDKAATAAIASHAQAESSWVSWGSKDTAAAVAGDGSDDDSSMAAILALLGVGALIASVKTQSEAPTPPSVTQPPSVTLSGSVFLGPVVPGSELSLGAYYFVDNKTIELGKTTVTDTSAFSVGEVALAAGRVTFLRLIDTNGDQADYIDETTRLARDIDNEVITAYAVGTGEDQQININTLTALASKKLSPSASAAEVNKVNAVISKLFLGVGDPNNPNDDPSILTAPVLPIVDNAGNAVTNNDYNADGIKLAVTYGIALAVISQYEHDKGLTNAQALREIAAGIDVERGIFTSSKVAGELNAALQQVVVSYGLDVKDVANLPLASFGSASGWALSVVGGDAIITGAEDFITVQLTGALTEGQQVTFFENKADAFTKPRVVGIPYTVTAADVANGYLRYEIQKSALVTGDDGTALILAEETGPNVDDIFGDTAVSAPLLVTVNGTDTTGPQLTITVDGGTTRLLYNQAATLTLTFSEVPSEFTLNDLIVTVTGGGTAGTLSDLRVMQDPKVYKVTYTPVEDINDRTETVSVTGSFKDRFGNVSAGASVIPVVLTYDTLPTKVTVTSDHAATPLLLGETAVMTFTFNESKPDFALSKLSVSGGTLSNLVVTAGSDDKVFTATFTPTANMNAGTATITFLAAGLNTDPENKFTVEVVSGSGLSVTSAGTGVSLNFDTQAPLVNASSFSVNEDDDQVKAEVGRLAADETVTWSIYVDPNNPNQGNLYEIDSETGVLSIKKTKNYEDTGANARVDTITVRATDSAGNYTDQEVSITLVDVINERPSLNTDIPTNQFFDQTFTVGLLGDYTFSVGRFIDPEGQPLTYTAALADGSALPSWLSFDAETRTFSGMPPSPGAAVIVPEISVRVTASDGVNTNSDTFQLKWRPQTPIATLAEDTGNSEVDSLTGADTTKDGITSNRVVNVTSLEANGQWRYSLDGGASHWSDWFDASEKSSFDLPNEDILYAISVQQRFGADYDASYDSRVSNPKGFVWDNSGTVPSTSLHEDTGWPYDNITNKESVDVSSLEGSATYTRYNENVTSLPDTYGVWSYSLDGGSTWSDWIAGSMTNFNIMEGINRIKVRQIDLAGNVSPVSDVDRYVLDTTSPLAPTLTYTDSGSSATDGITNIATVTVDGLEVSSLSWQYTLDGGTTWVTGGAFTGGDLTFNLKEGVNTVQVRQTDFVGNVSQPSTAVILTLDTQVLNPSWALADDTGRSNLDRYTSNGQINVGDLETGAVWSYSVDNGNTWSAAMPATTTSFTLAEGVYNAGKVRIRQTDLAGNTALVSLGAITVDTTDPDALSMTLNQDTGISDTDRITQRGQVNVVGVEPNGRWEYRLDVGTWTAGTGTNFFLLAPGTYNAVDVRHIDLAGNMTITNLGAVSVDVTPPAQATLALAADTGTSDSDRVTSNNQINVTGVDITDAWGYSVNAGGDWSFGGIGNGSFRVADGSYATGQVQVRVVDVAGNVSDPNNDFTAFTIDTGAPSRLNVSLSDTGSSNDDGIINDGRLTITGLEADTFYQVSTDGGANWTILLTDRIYRLTEGTYPEVQVRHVDRAGNTLGIVSLGAITVDTTDPAAATLTLVQDTGLDGVDNDDRITSNNLINVTGIDADAMWQYSVNSGATWSDARASDGQFTVADGSYGDGQVRVRVIDVAGNITNTTNLVGFTVDTLRPDPLTVTFADTGINDADRVTKDDRLSISGLEADAVYQVSTDGGTSWSANATGPIYTLGEGSYADVQVRHIDEAGNVSIRSLGSITVDTTPPALATLALAQDTGRDGVNNTDRITSNNLINVTGIEAGAMWQYSVNSGADWSNGGAGTAGSFRVADENYVTGQVQVRVVDAAGNPTETNSFAAFTVDTLRPDPLTVTFADTGINDADRITKDGRLSIAGLEADAVYQVSTDGGTSWSANATGPIYTLGEGSYADVQVRHIDEAGNVSIRSLGAITVDTTPPALATLALAQDTGRDGVNNTDRITSNNLINVTGIEAGAMWQYSVNSGATWSNGGAGTAGSFRVADENYVTGQVQVRVVDAAGNPTETNSFAAFTVDTLRPDPLTVTFADTGINDADRITKDGRLSIAGLEADAVYQVSTDGGTSWSANATGPIYTLGEGSYADVQVRHIDEAGNVSIRSLGAITVDTTPPALATLALAQDTGRDGVNNTDRITSNNLINVTGIEAGAMWQYSVNSGATWSNGGAGTAGSFRVADENYVTGQVQVRVVDAAGNPIETNSFAAFTVDTLRPDPLTVTFADTGISNADRITKDGRLSIAGLEADAVYQVSTDGGISWSANATEAIYTLAAGTHTNVQVRHIDEAGNVSIRSLGAITVDTTPPALATLALAQDTGRDGVNNTDRITSNNLINVTGIEAGAMWQYSVNSGADWSNGGAGTAGSFRVADENYVTGQVQVRVVDAAGNPIETNSFAAFTVDTLRPDPLTVTFADTGINDADRITKDGRLSIAGLEADAVYQVSTDGGTSWSANATGPIYTLGEGSYADVQVRHIDEAGNVSIRSLGAITVDTTDPAAATLTLNTDTGINGDDRITSNYLIDVTGIEAGTTWEYSLNNGATWSPGLPVNGNDGQSFLVFPDRAYVYGQVQVRVTDAAGNETVTNNFDRFTVDTVAPDPLTVKWNDTGISNADGITNDGRLTITGLEGDGDTGYRVSTDGGSTWSELFTDPTYTLAAGTYTDVQVRHVDVAGNSSITRLGAITVDTTAPAAGTTQTLLIDTGINNNDGVTAEPQIIVTGIETGAATEYSFDFGATWSPGPTADATGRIILFGPNGYYFPTQVQVRATDAAGNKAVTKSTDFLTLDFVDPDPLTVTWNDTGISDTDGITKDGRLFISGLEARAVYRVSTDGGVSWSVPLTDPTYALAAGTYTDVQVRHVDLAGNNSITRLGAITVDTAAPNSTPDTAVTMALAADTGIPDDRITSNSQINVTGIEAGARWEYSLNAGGEWLNGGIGDGSFRAPDENYAADQVQVRVIDAAGNVADPTTGFAAFTVITTATDRLTVTLVADTGISSSDRVTSDGTLLISGLASDAAYQVRTSIGGTTSTWSADQTSQNYTLAEGVYTDVEIRQIVGGDGSRATITSLGAITVDTTDPALATLALAVDTGTPDDRITSNSQINVTGVEAGARWEYSLNAGGDWSAGGIGNGSFRAPDEDYAADQVQVRVIDAAGNISDPTTGFAAFTVTTSALGRLTVTLVDDTGRSNSDRITKDGTLLISDLEPGAVYQVRTNIGGTFSAWSTDQTSQNYTLAEGVYTNVEIRQIMAGDENTATVTSLGAITVDTTAPALATMALVADTTIDTVLASSSDRITGNNQINVTGMEAGAIWEYSIDSGANWSTGGAVTSGASSFRVADGSYVDGQVRVRVVDAAGNRAETNSFDAFRVDTQAPNPLTVTLVNDTGISSADRITSDGRLLIEGLEAGAVYQVSTDGGGTWSAIADDGIYTLAEGTHTNVQVRHIDAAGNETIRSLGAITVDTTAPATTMTMALAADTGTAGDLITSNNQIDVTGIEAGAIWEYSIDSGVNWSTGGAVTSGASSFRVADGSYVDGQVRVRVVDAAGNRAEPNSFAAFRVDTQAPNLLTVTLVNDTGISSTDRITSDGRLLIEGIEAGAAYQVRINGGGAWSANNTSQYYTLVDSNYSSVEVRQVDVAGNISSTTNFGAITVDTTAPATTMTIALAADTGTDGDRITSNNQINVTGVETGAIWEYSIDNGVNWTTGGTETTGSFQVADGPYSTGQVQVRMVDVAGNRAETNSFAAFRVDTQAPAPLTVTLVNDTGRSNTDRITSDGRLLIEGIEAGSAYQVRIDGGAWGANNTSQYYTLVDGNYSNVQVRHIDAAGNETITNFGAITVDTTAPTTTVTMTLATDTGTAGDRITSNNQINVTGVETGAIWEYSIDNGVNWSTGGTETTGSFQVADGTYSTGQVQVRMVDAAGNYSTPITGFAGFTVDTVDPLITPAAFDVEENTEEVGQLFASENVTWAIVANDATNPYTIDPATGVLELNTAKDYEARDIIDRIQVSATDAAGNSTTRAVTITLLDVNEAPVNNNLVTNQEVAVAGASTWSFVIPQDAFIDPEGASLSYSLTRITPFGTGAAATDIVFDNLADTFRFGVTPSVNYSYSIALSISDGVNTVPHTFSVTVI